MLDTLSRRIIGPSRDPLVWYIGEKQADILLDPMEDHTRVLLYSAEGGGKSRLMAQWSIVQALRCCALGIQGFAGVTAPTAKRLDVAIDHIGECIPLDRPRESTPGAWGTYHIVEKEIRLHCGITLQCRATKKQSGATGSPVQGATWIYSCDDELQDTAANGADPDIEARLRGAKTSRRMATATAKDSAGWRGFRDEKPASPDWQIRRIIFSDNFAVWPDHWLRMQRNMSKREWDRRGLALDVLPENAVYPSFDRKHNCKPMPTGRRVKDITAKTTGGFAMQLGHDPGEIADVTEFLQCFEVKGERCWWVVDEVTTTGTSEAHVIAVRARLQTKWGIQLEGDDEPEAIVRCDPQGNTERRTDAQIYTKWRLAGFRIMSAQYTKTNKPQGRISKRMRIDMLNTLFCNTHDLRRLFIHRNEDGTVAAPRLLFAIEHSERDPITGEAEIKRSNTPDLSHWPCATGYGLWPHEKVSPAPMPRIPLH